MSRLQNLQEDSEENKKEETNQTNLIEETKPDQ